MAYGSNMKGLSSKIVGKGGRGEGKQNLDLLLGFIDSPFQEYQRFFGLVVLHRLQQHRRVVGIHMWFLTNRGRGDVGTFNCKTEK